MSTKLRDLFVGLAGLISSILAIVAFVTGRQYLSDFIPTSTPGGDAPQVLAANTFGSAAQPVAASPTEPVVVIPPTEAGESCEALPARLTPGGHGRVFRFPNENNRVRAEPSLTARQVGVILAGAEFEVIDGPVCEGTVNWWYVRYNGLSGWTAEGIGEAYFVEPS